MCPYYNDKSGVCKIYKTTQTNYNATTYCMEMTKPYKECPNYKQCQRVYGIVPPPYKFN